MKPIIISGLGPGHLEQADLIKSGMDPQLNRSQRENLYCYGNTNYHPTNLTYSYNGSKNSLLREIKPSNLELVSPVLKSILNREKISYEYLNAAHIWNNERSTVSGDIVCLSTTFMWSEKMLNQSMEWINRNINPKHIIIGGQYGSLKKNYLHVKYPNLRFIVTGDAELSLSPLLKAIDHGAEEKDLIVIPNLSYKNKKGEIIQTPQFCGNISEYPLVEFEGDMQVVPYISSKGCPHKCKFCAIGENTLQWIYLSSEKIISDWRKYKEKNNTKHFDVYDSTFFIPFSRMENLLVSLPSLDISWEANARADTPISSQIIDKLEESGCKALYFGFESMSETVLKYMDKRTTVGQNRHINELFRERSIDTMMSFIVGFPGETPEEHEKTRNYLLRDHKGHFNIYIFEFEDTTMPIWREKEKFKLEIYPDDISSWKHGGESWSHVGMDSKMAKKLRLETLQKIRLSDSCAVHRSWQYGYEDPLVPSAPRNRNLCIEKLVDKLIFAPVDFPDKIERRKYLQTIITDLRKLDIVTSKMI